MHQVRILNQKIFKKKNWTIKRITIEPPLDFDATKVYLGFDPGTKNLGIAKLWWGSCELYQVKIERNDDAVTRITNIRYILEDCGLDANKYRTIGVIEGASFAGYRQVELAEQRAAITIWLSRVSVDTSIVPPNTIKKEVLGHGRMKAHDFFTGIPNDAAAALSCAYYATKRV